MMEDLGGKQPNKSNHKQQLGADYMEKGTCCENRILVCHKPSITKESASPLALYEHGRKAQNVLLQIESSVDIFAPLNNYLHQPKRNNTIQQEKMKLLNLKSVQTGD